MTQEQKSPSPQGKPRVSIIIVPIVSLIGGIIGGYLIYNLLTAPAGDTVKSEEPPAAAQRPSRPDPRPRPEPPPPPSESERPSRPDPRPQPSPSPHPRPAVVGLPNVMLRDIAVKKEDSGPDGPVVARVEPDSPEERAGLQRGDVITKVEETVVRNTAEVNEILSKYQVKDRVTLQVNRGGEEDIPVTVDVQQTV